MALLSSGDRDYSLEKLRWLEFAGQSTREEGTMQRKSFRQLHRDPLESLVEYCVVLI